MIERLVCDLVARDLLSVESGAAILVEVSAVDGLDVTIIVLSIVAGAFFGAVS